MVRQRSDRRNERDARRKRSREKHRTLSAEELFFSVCRPFCDVDRDKARESKCELAIPPSDRMLAFLRRGHDDLGDMVDVRESEAVPGQMGVFATRRIPKGTSGFYKGLLVHEETWRKSPEFEAFSQKYALKTGKSVMDVFDTRSTSVGFLGTWRFAAVPGHSENYASYVNDVRVLDAKCTCEVGVRRTEDVALYLNWLHGWPFVIISTLRDIQANQEMFMDYGDEYWEIFVENLAS